MSAIDTDEQETGFTQPKTDLIGLPITSYGETSDGSFIIEFGEAYRVLIEKGAKITWQKRIVN